MLFCDKVNKLLEERGMRATDLANATGIGKSNIHYILSGRSKNPALSTLFAIANALNISMDELLEDVDPPAPSKNKKGSYKYAVVELP